MKAIYSRVSTDKQDTENQLAKLRSLHPDATAYEEVASGAKHRPILTELVGRLQRGDILVVAALDRLGRRTSEVLALIEDLEKRGVILISIREGVDYSTICGRLVTQILCSVAEMERSLIGERTKAAMAAKKAQGLPMGRPPKHGPEVYTRIKALREAGYGLKEIGVALGLSRGRVSQLLSKVHT